MPVWNGLTDDWHPTQSLCDAFTMLEASPKPAGEIAFSYLGDCRFNMGNSLLTMGAMMGMDVRLVSPRSFAPSADLVDAAREIAEFTGARITITDDIEAVRGSDFVHTDVWVSMGEPESVWTERILLPDLPRESVAVPEATTAPALVGCQTCDSVTGAPAIVSAFDAIVDPCTPAAVTAPLMSDMPCTNAPTSAATTGF